MLIMFEAPDDTLVFHLFPFKQAYGEGTYAVRLLIIIFNKTVKMAHDGKNKCFSAQLIVKWILSSNWLSGENDNTHHSQSFDKPS